MTTEFASTGDLLSAKYTCATAHRRVCEQSTATTVINLVRSLTTVETLATLVYSTVDSGLTIT